VAFHLVCGTLNGTNAALLEAFRDTGMDARHTPPTELGKARPGDVALGRLDVLPTLEGVEAGMWELRRAKSRGVHVLNEAGTLLAAHDKLATALRLAAAGLPHPRTAHLDGGSALPKLNPPLVVKPRFGSWGYDVFRCEDAIELTACLASLRGRRWFERQGAIVQELVPPCGYDLRMIVAAGEVVGAIERVAAVGEWRTNVALGGWRRPTDPPAGARALAVEAATAIGGDLVGVDLLPEDGGGWTVLELNGAVDFTAEYSLQGADVFAEIAEALYPAQPLEVAGAAVT
jgi:[lysine-biosynthesis-protein LysW]---L-2-aminoadipate ligase